MEKAQGSQARVLDSAKEERSDEISMSTITLSSELLAQSGVVMMASDWIPSGPLPAGPQFSEEEYKRNLERMHSMIPAWALAIKREQAAKGKAPHSTDNPLR